MTTLPEIDIKDKITSEQWQRLNEVAREALSCGYFIEDGQTEKAVIETEAVERFVQFLENYYVTDSDRDIRSSNNNNSISSC